MPPHSIRDSVRFELCGDGLHERQHSLGAGGRDCYHVRGQKVVDRFSRASVETHLTFENCCSAERIDVWQAF